MFQRPYPQLELHMGLVSACSFDSFWPTFVQKYVRKSELGQNTLSICVFLDLTEAEFFEIEVFQVNSLFNLSVSLLTFSLQKAFRIPI